MASKVRFGIVGTGGIANTHAAGLATLADDAELVACCDIDSRRVADFAERWGVRHQYDSARAMFDAGQIDVVCVCTPHPQHADPLVLAAERGIHGVVEKPLAATLRDADRVLEASARYGTILSTMSQRRWFPAAQRIRRAIDAGMLGPRLLLGETFTEMWRNEAYYRKDAWRGRWDTEGGGVLMNQAPHNIDFLLWYMGPAEEIFGYWGNLNHPYVEIEDNAVAVIRFRSGALGLLKGTVSMNPERRIHGVSLVGDSGATVSLDCWQVDESERRSNNGPFDIGSNDIWTIPDGQAKPVTRAEAIDYNSGELPNFHAHQLRDIIGAVRDKRPPAVTGEDGRRVVAIIQGVYESGRTGATGQALGLSPAKLRIGQIGTRHGHAAGKWQALCSNPDVEAVGIFEPDSSRRSATHFGAAHWFDSETDLLGDPGVVAVAIEGRNHESLAMAARAIAAGKHLWFDKPAGDDFPAFQRLMEAAGAQGLRVQMGYMFRYSPGFARVAELVRSGALGEPFAVRAHMSTNVDLAERTEQSRHRGGILYDLGAHMLDQIVWLLGRPTRVSSVLRNDATPALPTYADNTVSVLEFDRGLAIVDIAAMEPRPAARRFEVYGNRGSAILEPFDPARTIRLALQEPAQDVQVIELPQVPRQALYDRELNAFVGVLRGEQSPDRPPEHELLVQETLLRLTGSLA